MVTVQLGHDLCTPQVIEGGRFADFDAGALPLYHGIAAAHTRAAE
jgi:hypothetical protein